MANSHKPGTNNDFIGTYAPVGSIIYDAYWRYVYRVVSHNTDGTMTIEMVDHWRTDRHWYNDLSAVGNIGRHRTPLDEHDEILFIPSEPIKNDPRVEPFAEWLHNRDTCDNVDSWTTISNEVRQIYRTEARKALRIIDLDLDER